MDKQYYDYLDRQTTALLALAAPVIDDESTQEARHFIDHDEYGLALGTIAFALAENRRGLTAELRDLVLALASTMNLQDDEFIRALRNITAEAH